MPKVLNHILKGIFIVFLITFPSLFSTYFANNFEAPKIFLLIVVSGLALAALGIELAALGKVHLKTSSFDLPLLLLVLSFVISAVVKTPNKMEAFLLPGSVTVITSGFLLYFFSKKAFDTKKDELVNCLLFSGLLISLLSIFAFLGIFNKIPQLPEFMKAVIFSPVGGKIYEVILLFSLVPLGIGHFLGEKDTSRKVLYGLVTLIILMAAVMGTALVLPDNLTTPVFAGTKTSWSVATQVIKTSPIFGIGPANYLTAFNIFLPISHNSTDIWSARFSSASSFFLTLITEAGLLGLLSFLIVILVLIKGSISKLKNLPIIKNPAEIGGVVSIFLVVVSLFLFPANMVLIIFLFFLLSLNSNDRDWVVRLPALTSSILFLMVGLLFYFMSSTFAAERQYKLAINSIVKNDGKSAYDGLGRAININPYVDRYHATYSQVNIALARGLAQKTDLTDQEKETVAQLIQQAIRESKAVVSLNPQRSGSWEVLARTYQTIMPFAQGADEYTIQTFNQAIALDPINPTLRIDLGGVYYALGRYNEAIKAFELAVVAKPDLANAHYNLAVAYKDKGDIKRATEEMNIMLSLVGKDSANYEVAVKELESIENITDPKEVEDPTIVPQLELPEGSGPPNQ